MTIVLSTLALVGAVLIGIPLIVFGIGSLMFVTAARGRLELSGDTVFSTLLTLAGAALIAATAINLGTHL